MLRQQDYNYFRDYDPTLGRYITSDPIGLSGGLNTFSYVLNDPTSLFDFYGLASRSETRRLWNDFHGPRRPGRSPNTQDLERELERLICEYGRVSLSASGGMGFGATGRLIVTSRGISGYVGVGVGIGLGASATVGAGASNASGAGVATSVTANAGVGPGANANITAGTNGVTGSVGVGVGIGAGAAAVNGFGGPIVQFSDLQCGCSD